MKKFIVILSLSSCALLCSCANAPERARNSAAATIRQGMSHTYDRQAPYALPLSSHQGAFEARNAENDERAAAVSRMVKGLPGIDSASAVITDDTAVVDIAVKGRLDDAKLTAVKREVRQKVLEFDKALKRVTVAAGKEMTDNLNDKADLDGVEQAHPRFDGGAERILRKLTPPV